LDLNCFYTEFSYFINEFEKKFQKKVAKFLKNGFLVLSEQSRNKLKDCRKNHKQIFFEIRKKTQSKPKPKPKPKPDPNPNPNPNPTQTEPNPKELEPVATLILSN
jgi:hypothetical protein